MPGTAEDPVKLGPFKRLKEVHWPGMIVFRRTVKVSATGGSGDVCTPSIGTIPAGYSQVYSDSTFLLYDSDEDATWVRSGGEWVLTGLSMTLTGMPDLPGATTRTYGYMEMHLVDLPWQSPVDGAPIEPSLPVPPDAGSGNFANGLEISVDVLGNNFTGGSACYSPPVFGPLAFESRPYGAQSVLSNEDLDLRDVVAEIEGKAFRAIATRLVDNTTPDTGTIDIYVLCKRSQADDPTT